MPSPSPSATKGAGHPTKGPSDKEIIARQKAQINDAQGQENDFLRQIRRGWGDVTSRKNPPSQKS